VILSSDFKTIPSSERSPEDILFERADQAYPRISGTTWKRMDLMELGSSVNSISASLGEDYEELPGFRELPYSDFGDPNTMFYSANDWKRAEILAEKIRLNRKIEPLIIAIDSEGPYILEGGHRFVALSRLGFQSFPALVIIEYS
jgi:hypothetical protein